MGFHGGLARGKPDYRGVFHEKLAEQAANAKDHIWFERASLFAQCAVMRLDMSLHTKLEAFRKYLQYALDNELSAGGIPSAIRRLLMLIIAANLGAGVLESVPALHERYKTAFHALEFFSFLVFGLEYAARVWSASDQQASAMSSHTRARISFITSGHGLIDLVVLVTFVLPFFTDIDLRVLLVFRVLRAMKLARYSSGMRSLIEALIEERRALWACLMLLVCATLVAATAMYLAEGKVQPDKLGTIPDAAWWAIVTLGTIGYGDVIPITVAGRLVASVTIVAGLIMIALPVGIVATAFADVIHRREFIVTWSMVARVPLFSDLKASDIAHIMQLLRAERFDRDEIIARRGEEAHSMYFVASGDVQIDPPAGATRDAVRLGAGQFFGEVAALKRTRRSATVRALSRAHLLALDADDLHGLMLREPAIAERIRAVVRERVGDLDNPQGDLTATELSNSKQKL